ncbi:hypothetical protein IAT38_005249 [Cryptococcus sp. DSM 104549]
MASLLATAVYGQTSSTVTPRWGHAAAYLPSPPTLIIQGGKTDPSSLYTYSSSPNTDCTVILPLTSSFAAFSAPLTELSTPDAPTAAWHTLSPVFQSGDTWQLLSFGGDGGTQIAVQTLADSAWLFGVDPSDAPTVNFTQQDQGWAAQPTRRIYHSAATSAGGKVFVTGGLKDDGSGFSFSDVSVYDPAKAAFDTFPSLPVGLYHHNSVLLPNGTLVVFGGAFTSTSTGNAELQAYSTLYKLDTTSRQPSWVELNISGEAPQRRRGATAVLSKDGKKAVVLGGASAGLGEAYGDVWALDMDTAVWTQVTGSEDGAGPRFDHTAVAVGGDQVVVFGGFTATGPADSQVYIFNTASMMWVADFTVVSSASGASQSESSLPTDVGAGGAGGQSSIGQSGVATNAGSQMGSETISASGSSPGATTVPGVVDSSQTISQIAPAASSTDSEPSDAGANSHPLSSSVITGLVLASLAVFALVFGLCFWCMRRRRQRPQQSQKTPVWPASGPRGRIPSGAARPYGDREKGGPGLMDEMREEKGEPNPYGAPPPGPGAGWGGAFGAGVGALGAGIASLSSKLSSRAGSGDPYAELHDRSPEEMNDLSALPTRQPTRRVGNGIRLIGPRPQRGKSIYYAPDRSDRPALASVVRDSRIDMFGDEDSRRFSDAATSRNFSDAPTAEEDMGVLRSASGRWRSANSLLDDRYSDTDFDDDAPILAPFKGGPVPTPHASATDVNDLARRGSELSNPHSLQYKLPVFAPTDPLDLDVYGMLRPHDSSMYSDNSMTPSQISGVSSRQPSDLEEGVVHDVRRVHPDDASSMLRPVPIRRTDSFLKRLAGAGVTALLGHRNSQSSATRSRPNSQLEIRDPAPQPTLWPIVSQDQLPLAPESTSSSNSPDTTRAPPVSWRADVLQAPRPTHHTGPSLSSLNSARSMRNMVIIQREAAASSTGTEGVISEGTPEPGSSPRGSAFSEGLSATVVDEHEQREAGMEMKEKDGAQSLMDFGVREIEAEGSQSSRREGGMGSLVPDIDFGPSMLDLSLNEPTPVAPAVTRKPSLPSIPEVASEPVVVGAVSEQAVEETVPVPATPKQVHSEPLTEEPVSMGMPVEEETFVEDTPTPVPAVVSTPRRLPPASTFQTPSAQRTTAPSSPTPAPSPSTTPNPLLYSRRRVRDVVNSINKRGASTPMSLLAPKTTYSPAAHDKALGLGMKKSSTGLSSSGSPSASSSRSAPTGRSTPATLDDPFLDPPLTSSASISTALPSAKATPPTTPRSSRILSSSSPRSSKLAGSPRGRMSPAMGRSTTMWEVIKKEEQLRVANPDERRRNASGSQTGA